MAAILIYGPSGYGKTTAISPPGGPKLPPEKTFVICIDSKPLPFPGWELDYKKGRNYIEEKDPVKVLDGLKKIEASGKFEYVVLDSLTHTMMKMFMDEAHRKDWDKWTEFAKKTYDIYNYVQSMTANVVCINHEEDVNTPSGVKQTRVRTMGKLLDEKVEIPSMFTYVFFPTVKYKDKKAKYSFQTQSNGTTMAKTPYGMFPFEIDNNYKKIFDRIDAYGKDAKSMMAKPKQADSASDKV